MNEVLEKPIKDFISDQIAFYGITTVSLMVLVIGVCLFLGKLGIESKFSQEVSKFKLRVDSTFNRLTKLHDIEFAMLPELWHHLATTYNKFEGVYFSCLVFTAIEDCNDVLLKRLNDFLEKEPLSPEERDEIRNTDPNYRFQAHQRMKLKKAYHEVEGAIISLDEYYKLNKIFIGADLRAHLEAVLAEMWLVWHWLKYGAQVSLPASLSFNEEYEKRYAAMRKTFKDIDREFRKPLYPSEKMDQQDHDK